MHFMAKKGGKTVLLFELFILERKCIYSSYKGSSILNKVCERGTFSDKNGI